MSNNDYADGPRRSGRRATREPAAPAKVQGSTAAAILVLVAIAGFGIGALIGNSSGDDPDTTAVEDTDGAPPGSPDTDTSNPDSTEGEESTGDGDGEEQSATSVTFEMADSAPAGEELEYTVRTDPPQPGLVLGVERRFPGEDWTPFGDPQLEVEIGDDGDKSGHVITSRVGEAEWRVVGETNGQRVESNVVAATITGEDDNSGPGDGNGNGDNDD